MLQHILIYNLKAIICSGLLLLYYSIVLRNTRFHDYNRFYLLITVLLSVTLPLLRLEWFTLHTSSAQTIQVFNIIYSTGGEEMNPAAGSFFNWQQVLLYALAFTGLTTALNLIRRIIKIFSLKKKFPVTKMTKFDFVVTDLQQAPFSFFRNIFWRKDISLHEETGKQILQHEITHISQRHSWDKLLMQSILCFYWMNPFFWWLKKELYLIHEFIADEKAVTNNDASSFAKMLLATQCRKFDFLPAQSFFYSPIKRRLTMLTNSKRSQFSYLRRLMILPLIVAVACLFAFTVKKETFVLSQQKIIANKPFVLVVDAGHGGKDLGADGNGLYEKDVTLKIAEKIKSLSPEYGIDVVLTRNGDVFMPPPQRVDFANAQHADAFISVHVNAAEKSQQEQSGFEINLAKSNAQTFSSVLLGSAILQSLQADFKTVPSLLQGKVGIWVLDKSMLPAALVECGYITNSDDAILLKNDAKIELIAKKILNGAALYANNKNSITPQSVTKFYKDTSVPEQSNSLLPAQAPLYVLEGKVVTKEKADEVDPSCIEQVIVLKGKDATDKYGDKGKNGAVEIIIKKDKNGVGPIIIRKNKTSKIKEPVQPPPPPPKPDK